MTAETPPNNPRRYDAKVTYEDEWFAITIDGIGATNAQDIATISDQAHDLVQSMTGQTDVEIYFHFDEPTWAQVKASTQ
jgi:hypothetical protein